jgi:hypothetical protein
MGLLVAVLWGWMAAQTGFSSGFVVHQPGDAAEARGVSVRAEATLKRLESLFGLQPSGPVQVVLAASQAEFKAALPEDAPDWASGVAFPSRNLIILKSFNVDSRTRPGDVLDHELAHLILRRLFGSRTVPTWLEEGLTMHMADEIGWGRQWAMTRAVGTKKLIPLADLAAGFPEETMAAETAYAESYYFIAYLRNQYGRDALGRLIRDLAVGHTLDGALARLSGGTTTDLEERFFGWLQKRFGILALMARAETPWVVMALLTVAAGWFRLRAAARKRAAWEEADGFTDGAGRPGTARPGAWPGDSVRVPGRRRIRRPVRTLPPAGPGSDSGGPPAGDRGPDQGA